MTITTGPEPEITARGDFAIGREDFLLDGEPFRIVSGALHYFRVHPGQWEDRVDKARMLGLNTIETYVPWNAHQPQPGKTSFAGGLDLERFLDIIHDRGMRAIVRPGPYICAEWDGGGLPGWLLRKPEVQVRSSEPLFLEAVQDWFSELLPRVAKRQITRGGPVIMMQVENEYGAYGDDQVYLKALAAMLHDGGIEVPLFTSDQPDPLMLARGGLAEVHKTANFGARTVDRLQTLRQFQPSGPLMCTEFWNGWFDVWGGPHHVTDAQSQAGELDALLAAGGSVNLYMFHGGTNFGFTNGANDKGTYRPTATSYDYDAPLSEDGAPTEKYWAFREVISRYVPVPAEAPSERAPAPTPALRPEGFVSLTEVVTSLGAEVDSETAPTMDELGQYGGYCLYAVDLPARTQTCLLSVSELRDRAVVTLGDTQLGTLSRETEELALPIPAGPPVRLTLLVEDQGRVNYGPRIGEVKGLVGPVTLDGHELRGWTTRPLELSVSVVAGALLRTLSSVVPGPAFAVAAFDLDDAADLFLDTSGWVKGVAWVNGFCLGRYWSRGPQQTLYVPAPVTQPGRNELVLFETYGGQMDRLAFRTTPGLG